MKTKITIASAVLVLVSLSFLLYSNYQLKKDIAELQTTTANLGQAISTVANFLEAGTGGQFSKFIQQK